MKEKSGEGESLIRVKDRPNYAIDPVGKIVYKAYTPARCGKVISDEGFFRRGPGLREFQIVTVKWKNGTTSQEIYDNLQDFEALVEEHKRKYENHSATLGKLRLL